MQLDIICVFVRFYIDIIEKLNYFLIKATYYYLKTPLYLKLAIVYFNNSALKNANNFMYFSCIVSKNIYIFITSFLDVVKQIKAYLKQCTL